jgi:hypothetical protein
MNRNHAFKLDSYQALHLLSSVCSLASRYDNPIPTRFQAPIDCSKIPAHIFAEKKEKDSEEV